MSNNISQAILNKARVNKFVMVLNLPKKLMDKKMYSLDELQFSVQGTVFPEININSDNLAIFGQHMNIPNFTRQQYSDLNIKYVIDNQWLNYLSIYNWINIFNDEKESIFDINNDLNLSKQTISKKLQELVATQTIIAMDEYNNKILKLTYTDAFPVKLNSINFDYSKGDEISCDATFKFNQFYVDLY